MEYCGDGNLQQKINQRAEMPFTDGYFPEDQILDWFAMICLGVRYIHQKKILHRDLKPKNIYVTKRGVCKLAGFGASTEPNEVISSTDTVEVGTPYYMAPELFHSGMCSQQTDSWALGVILYELCALKVPFKP